MKFELITLIDITETRAKFNKLDPSWHQQQNFITALSTIGIRANPIVEKSPTFTIEPVKGNGFGSSFNGEQKIWRLEFEFESDGAHSLDLLRDDFNLVTVITGLEETVSIKEPVFDTVSKGRRNTVFKCYD